MSRWLPYSYTIRQPRPKHCHGGAMNGSTAVDKVLGPLESDHKQARATIISLMRGAFSCPVVATLADLGMTEQMLAGSFSVGDFKSVKNPSALGPIFTY